MIVPALSHDALLDDVHAANVSNDRVRMWWLGQSGFLVQWNQRHLLLDPYLSDSLTVKYATTDKPHVRMTQLAIDPARLDFIDVVTSSHNHTDHLDGETLIPLLRANPEVTIVVAAANRQFAAERLQCRPDRLTSIDDGGSVDAAGFSIHAIP
ncbi:MAG: MBL fold metallo-hydrolase, partial [Planctomycetota bacterium]